MEAIWTAVIAVAGTLLGSAVTYLFQRRASERSEAFSFQQQLRAERMIAYSDFAGTIAEFSRSQDHRWFRVRDDPNNLAAFDSRIERDQFGSKAYHALARVQLVSRDIRLIDAARNAYDLTWDLHRASTKEDLDARARRTNDALEEFIKIASLDVQQDPAALGNVTLPA